MGRTLDPSPDYPTSNWDLNHPSSAWELCPSQNIPLSIHFFSDSRLVWKYNIQRWLWRLSFVKVHFWEAPMIGFLDREKTLSEPSVPMSTSLTGHVSQGYLTSGHLYLISLHISATKSLFITMISLSRLIKKQVWRGSTLVDFLARVWTLVDFLARVSTLILSLTSITVLLLTFRWKSQNKWLYLNPCYSFISLDLT